MMNRGEVQKVIEQFIPGAIVKGHRSYPYRNSKIIIADLQQCNGLKRLVLKFSRDYDPSQVAIEFQNLSRFHSGCRDPRISSPKPLFADPKRGFFAMSHVEGTHLAYMLHEIKPKSIDYLNRVIDLSALALARFHQLNRWPDKESVSVATGAREEEINRCIAENEQRINDCGLCIRVTPFFDFTSWNILVEDGGSKLCIIDFPRMNYVFTPHLDLARFRFGLELTKQFPPARFLGINRWDVNPLFDRFLRRYCLEMAIDPSEEDRLIINSFLGAFIRRAQNLRRKGKCGWQPYLEKAYLQTFSREWLKGSGFSAERPPKQ